MERLSVQCYQAISVHFSLAVTHIEQEQACYQDLFRQLRVSPVSPDPKLTIRIHYNAALHYLKKEEYHTALELTSSAIDICLTSDLFYLLAHLYHIQAIAIYSLDQNETGKALSFLDQALFLHHLEQDQVNIDNVLDTKSDLIKN